MKKPPPPSGRAVTFSTFFFTAPALTGLTIFVLLPFVLAIILSLTNVRLGSPVPSEFVGLRQYQRILSDPTFRQAIINNSLFAAVVVPLQTICALLLALMLNTPLRGMAVFRTLFFMPVIFPLSLVAVIWVLILAPGPDGMLNSFLEYVTFGHWQPKNFLRDPYLALPSIMLTSIWQGVGFQMIIILAGLQAIPQNLYEAAAVDGANRLQQLFRITLPMLRNTLLFVILVTTILSFRLFDQVQVMTRGGPNDGSTTVMYEAVQTAFVRLQIAKGSAMTVILFLIVLLLTLMQRYLVRRSTLGNKSGSGEHNS